MNRPHSPKELVSSVNQLATLPELHIKLLNVINSPNSSAMDMAKVISHDPGLTARLLKQSNSAYYGQGSTVATVSTAITVVGVQQLREISLSTSVVRLFNRLPQDLLDMDEFWRHCVLVGLIARELARKAEIDNTEQVFIAGLLHDVGRILMLAAMPVEFRKAMLYAKAAGQSLNKVEHDQIGFTHAQVGGELFRSWGLPQSLQNAVEFHHFPGLVKSDGLGVLIIHLADVMAHSLEVGNSGESRVPPLHAGAWEELGLDPAILPELLLDTELSVNDVTRSMMHTGDAIADQD